ncbi:hypothetical protein RN001_006395 [Aquatica leii]|uniref:RING-type domain-containing protein n=1 Tax=Aquatica leii TaxID=1421715 RepID=A0AAN7PIH9_9COLE|nr:hypothetical protein RN001_006395 [Aquatica leii]
MNIEENRLQTFTDWPSDAAVSPVRIAKAGFYSLNQNLTVKCFCCGVEISEWNYGDQVMAKHRDLSPSCGFVLDSSTSGNIPNLPSSTFNNMSSEDLTDSPNYSYSLTHEAVRLQSFENWPVSHIVTPESLAKAGFYYLKKQDKTKCAFCNGVILAWEVGDNPDYEHKRHFPNCSFVLQVITPRLEHQVDGDEGNSNRFPNLNIVSQTNFFELGVNEHKGPKKSKYATFESRLRTFTMWPEDIIQTPEVLAQAGFYYEGCGDQVRCFHCDGGLRHWHPLDDPWTEHARWFPKCGYVLLVKGQDFIVACTDGSSANTDEDYTKCARPYQRKEITEREIQAQMLTPPVMTALSIGLHVGRIKQAIKEKLDQTGIGFATADAVIEATLNLQLDEDESTDPHIAQEVNQILADALNRTINQNEALTKDAQEVEVSVEKCLLKKTDDSTSDKPLTLEEENRLLKEARLCKICMDNEVGIVFLPCGHLATCFNCAPNLEDCPVCRRLGAKMSYRHPSGAEKKKKIKLQEQVTKKLAKITTCFATNTENEGQEARASCSFPLKVEREYSSGSEANEHENLDRQDDLITLENDSGSDVVPVETVVPKNDEIPAISKWPDFKSDHCIRTVIIFKPKNDHQENTEKNYQNGDKVYYR